MNTTKLLYNLLLENSLKEVIQLLGMPIESIVRTEKKYNEFLQTLKSKNYTIENGDKLIRFIQDSDFDDKEKVFLGAEIMASQLQFKIKNLQE